MRDREWETGAAQRTDLDTAGIDVGLTALVAQSDADAQPNFTRGGERKAAPAQSGACSFQQRIETTSQAPLSSPIITNQASQTKHHTHIANWRRDDAHKLART
jgi:hypothetical protein